MIFIDKFYDWYNEKKKKQRESEIKFSTLQKRPAGWSIDMGHERVPIQYRISYLGMNEEDRGKFMDAVWTDMQNGKLKSWKE
jgi:hypothetical protein